MPMKHFILATALVLLAGCSSSPAETETTTTAVPLTAEEVLALRTKLGGLSEEFQKSIYKQAPSDLPRITARANWFAEMGGLLKKGETSGDSACRKLATGLRPLLAAQQRDIFPKMRQNYASWLRHEHFPLLKETKADQSAGGTLLIRANEFSDQNKQAQIRTQYQSNLTALRFKQVKFVWGDKANESKSFVTGALDDSNVSSQTSGHI